MDQQVSIQERLYPEAMCFGCGHANAKGLRLRSYPAEGYVEASFSPWPEHDNGLGFLNGGIVATLLDCHSGAAVFHEADRRGWRPAPGLPFAFVTAGLDIRYLRPAPLHVPSELRAVVALATDDEMTVDVELRWEGKARTTAVARWKRWRPR